jgi:hypothetical protein
MQSLLNSMTPEMRQSLQQMMDSLLKDDRLKWDLMQLAANMERLLPMRQYQGRYPFRGDESLSMEEAMRLMDQLQELDQLERQLRRANNPDALDQVDAEQVRELLGPEAAEQLEQLRQLTKLLEDAGYIQKQGDKYELTAKGIRKIGQKALQDIFHLLKKDAFGKHTANLTGRGGERTDESKAYEFGDPFYLDIETTLRHALGRGDLGIAVGIKEAEVAAIVCRGAYKSIQRRGAGSGIHQVELGMSFIPRWAWIFNADGLQRIGLYRRAVARHRALGWRRRQWIASWIGWRQSGRSAQRKLRKTVKRLIRITVVRPVLA